MKKTVWTFGLISGLVLSISMLASWPFLDELSKRNLGEVVGYSTMVLAFLLVYFGVRSYRDNVLGGTIGFGRAFGVGMLIVAVASVCYVATWELIYYKLHPDFAEKYAQAMVDKARASGATPEAIAQKTKDARNMAALYNNPLINVAITFMEPMPPGVVLALLSAAVLRRKRRGDAAIITHPATAV